MCEVRSRKNGQEQKKKKKKVKKSTVVRSKIHCVLPQPAPNEKTQPIQWTERPTGALVAVNSLWPEIFCSTQDCAREVNIYLSISVHNMENSTIKS
jgi:hypothetical protein